MDFQVILTFWEDTNGLSPISAVLDSMHEKQLAWLLKKNEYFERHRFRELSRSKYWERISGSDYELYELKYFSRPPYRAICVPWNAKVVLLEIFEGSGSGGKVLKHLPPAIARAKDWKKRFPINS